MDFGGQAKDSMFVKGVGAKAEPGKKEDSLGTSLSWGEGAGLRAGRGPERARALFLQ